MKRSVTPARVALTLLVASAIGSQAVAGVNLLDNPGFEDRPLFTGWTVFGSGPNISGDEARTGAQSAKIFGEFTNCPDFPQFDVGGFFQAFTPAPDMVYEFGGYAYVQSGDPIPGSDTCASNRLIAKIAFFDAVSGGAEISSNEIVIGDWQTVPDQWNAFSVSAPTPSGALRVEALFLFLQPACDAGAVFVDDVSLVELSAPEPPTGNLLANASFDSGLSGWSTFGNAFAEGNGSFVRTAPGSAKMFSTFTPESPSGMFQTFGASAGMEFEMRAHGLASCADPINGGANYAIARIVFLDAVEIEIGGEEVTLADASSPPGTWTESSVSAAAPVGTVQVQAYLLFISPLEESGAIWFDDVFFGLSTPLGVDASTGPGAITLHQNTPNPFNPTTRITFVLERADVVDLGVYDVFGRRVATLVSGTRVAGRHAVSWDGITSRGLPAAAGVYRYVLTTSSGRESRRMVLTP